MWYHDPHPDAREGPVNTQTPQECETHKATDEVLLTLLGSFPFPLFISKIYMSLFDIDPDMNQPYFGFSLLQMFKKDTTFTKCSSSLLARQTRL